MAHVHRTTAALRIFGDNLDPDEISRLLGGVPSCNYRKGEVKKSKIKDIVRKTGAWILDASDCEPENLDAQIQELFERLTQDLTVWVSLSENYEVDLFCGLFMEHIDEGIEISVKSLKILSERGIKVGICIYAPHQDVKANDPCPCNSGRKYIECCAPKSAKK